MSVVTVQTEIYRIDELPDDIRRKIAESPDHLYRSGGKIFLGMDSCIIVSCPDNPDGNRLVFDIMLRHHGDEMRTGHPEDVFFRLLNDSGFKPDRSFLNRYRIRESDPRCAVVFRSEPLPGHDLFSVFSDMVPLESGDVILPADYQTVCLIGNMKTQSQAELKEYAEAVIGTLEGEGYPGVKAGIGNCCSDVCLLRFSFQEAREALVLGSKYEKRGNVFLYGELTLERILDTIPPEEKTRIRDQFFRHFSPAILTDEMRETVRVFFQNDLNVTAASRQLFVHRNTLNYRLDKIRKDTGLDLRSFRDAVVFRIVTGISDE